MGNNKLYVHYSKDGVKDKDGEFTIKPGQIISFQEAPEGFQDETPKDTELLVLGDEARTRPVWVKDQQKPDMHFPNPAECKVVDGKLEAI